ncbi:hypothetical protein BT63DRAFT_55067 [Microthyrium microscopicum]|uniref:Uncharacterized protein n=1 Tax=Microthyrium microscopicum TaxID=703497 RepID=A0A6A6U4R5_9PEZI|nr:hypothetical protein BT63DRAFT_55067 [Microthyrium microscopicum]
MYGSSRMFPGAQRSTGPGNQSLAQLITAIHIRISQIETDSEYLDYYHEAKQDCHFGGPSPIVIQELLSAERRLIQADPELTAMLADAKTRLTQIISSGDTKKIKRAKKHMVLFFSAFRGQPEYGFVVDVPEVEGAILYAGLLGISRGEFMDMMDGQNELLEFDDSDDEVAGTASAAGGRGAPFGDAGRGAGMPPQGMFGASAAHGAGIPPEGMFGAGAGAGAGMPPQGMFGAGAAPGASVPSQGMFSTGAGAAGAGVPPQSMFGASPAPGAGMAQSGPGIPSAGLNSSRAPMFGTGAGRGGAGGLGGTGARGAGRGAARGGRGNFGGFGGCDM